jgi:hypothetical protein
MISAKHAKLMTDDVLQKQTELYKTTLLIHKTAMQGYYNIFIDPIQYDDELKEFVGDSLILKRGLVELGYSVSLCSKSNSMKISWKENNNNDS